MKVETSTYPTPLVKLLEFCAWELGVEPEAVRGKSRKKEVVMARHFYRYLAKAYLGGYYSLAVIGSLLANANHANVYNSCKNVTDLKDTEGGKKGTYGYLFKTLEKKFVEEELQTLLLQVRKTVLKDRFEKSGLLRRQQMKIIKRDKAVSAMYNEFLKISKTLKEYAEHDGREGFINGLNSLLHEKKQVMLGYKMNTI